jgi:hypothetical protein
LVERHAGRVARVVMQALDKRRLLRTRVLEVDIAAVAAGLEYFQLGRLDGLRTVRGVVIGDGDAGRSLQVFAKSKKFKTLPK